MDNNTVSSRDKLIAISKAYHDWSDKSFSLSEINHLLASDYQPDDFNAFPIPILTMSDLRTAIAAAKETVTNPEAPWLMLQCSCGNPITVSHRNLQWRRKVDAGLPCMCQECIDRCLGRTIGEMQYE